MPPRRKSTQNAADADNNDNAPARTGASQDSNATRLEPPRITPRNSLTEGETTTPVRDTPYAALHQLASIIKKPTTPTRASSASPGPPSTIRPVRRTPGQNVTPIAAGMGRTPTASTPYGRAAIREIAMRRAAALTPGKDRRRSGRQQRETPRDILRQLSKVLAPVSQPIEATPTMELPPPLPRKRLNDMDDDAPLPRPRLSMPLGDDEDDSLLLPPHLSDVGLEDENLTTRSVEMPRRAISEQPGSRLSNGSFGSVILSDRFDTTMPDFGGDADVTEGFDPSFVQGGFDDDEPLMDDPSLLIDRTPTMDMRSGFASQGPRRSSGASRRSSEVRGRQEDESEITFQFQVPQRAPEDTGAQSGNARRRSSAGVLPEDARAGRQSLGTVREEVEDDVSESENERFEPEEEQGDEEMEEPDDDDLLEEEVEAEYEEDDDDDVDGGKDGTTLRPIADDTMDITKASNIGATSSPKGMRGRPKGVSNPKKAVRVSKHGIPYPSVPAGVVKKLASSFARTGGNNGKISKDTLAAIMQATDWFFEQMSEDLGSYAEHAGRKTIDDSDVLLLMQRQRQINASTTPFALAQKHLPRELLQDMRMVPPTKLARTRKTKRVEEEEDE